MIKLHPHILARLREVLEFLEGTPFAAARDTLQGLKRIAFTDNEQAVLRDDDVVPFRRDFEQLLKLLQIESRNNSTLFRTAGDNAIPLTKKGAQTTASTANGKDPSDIYARSGILQSREFSTDDATLLIQLITFLPAIRAETNDGQLRTTHLLQALAGAKRILDPGQRLLQAATAYDSYAINIARHQLPSDPIERPEDAVNYAITNMPQIIENGLLPQFVLSAVLPKLQNYKVAFYRTAVAYNAAFQRFSSIDRETAKDPDRLISALEKIAQEVAAQYLNVKIQPSTLFRAYASMNGISNINAYWNVLDMRALYMRSRILQDLRFRDNSVRPETLLPKLITLLPLIREETGVEELTLRDCLFALIEGGILYPPHGRFLDAASTFDLYGHKMLVAMAGEDLSTREKFFDDLIHVRPDISGYEDGPLTYFVNALILMGAVEEEKRRHYTIQATIYDRAFEKATRIVADMPEDETPMNLVQKLATMAQEVLESSSPGDIETDISMLSIVKYLALNNMLQGYIEQYLVAAAAADMSLASKLLGEVTADVDTPDDRSSGMTPNFDRFSRNIKPFMKLAAARDFYALFARELHDEDTETPESLIRKLDSIRTTLEGYEHEPLTTFVSALAEVGKLNDDVISFIRYAAAHDLWDRHLNYIDDEDLRSPERLVAKIVELRQDMPGYEQEPLATFVEALAVLGRIPDDLDAYTDTASLYDAMLPPDKKDPAGGSTPANPTGNGSPPPPAASGSGSSHASAVIIDGFEPASEIASPPAAQAASTALFMGTLFRTAIPQMPLPLPMTGMLPVIPVISGLHLNT